MKQWKQIIFLASLALATLFLMSCGGKQTDTDSVSAAEIESEAEVPAVEEEAALSGKIVIGEISDDPSRKIPLFQPLVDYLAVRLDDQGISVGEVKVAPDMDTMIQWLEEGEVDIYFDSPYPAMVVGDASGAQPFLRRWKDGVEEYNTVIFTQADEDLTSLEDLQGQIIGFEEDFSTSGYFLPLAYLLEAGLTPVEKRTATASVAEDEVGYFFTGEVDATIQMVLSGEIAAGALDSEGYLEIPGETRAELVVLLETEKVARHVGLASPQMDPELLDAVTSVLLNMDEDEEGQSILETFEETSQFDLFPEGTATSTLERMRELYALVEGS
jgi:phosphonate transport system substrate-binding protein